MNTTYSIASLLGEFIGLAIIFAILASPIILIIFLVKKKTNKTPTQPPTQSQTQPQIIQQPITAVQQPKKQYPYIVVPNLLTAKEYRFYQSLKPIADKYRLEIMCKVRLADLVLIPKQIANYMKWFNHVKAKHIDFVLCAPDMEPVLLIEVDDYTHDREDRKQRDEFVDSIFEEAKIKLLHIRTWTAEQLERYINEALPYSTRGIKSALPCPNTGQAEAERSI